MFGVRSFATVPKGQSWPGPNPLIDIALGTLIGIVATSFFKLHDIEERAQRIRRWHLSDRAVDDLVRRQNQRDFLIDLVSNEEYRNQVLAKDEKAKAIYEAFEALPQEDKQSFLDEVAALQE
jgi:hypothetical protein